MPGFKLIRNSRVFFTSNVDSTTGAIPTSGASIDNTNTFEVQVLDGFSFSQATQQTTIQVSEAGNTPIRGQRSFNTSLDAVEFSFSTYMRPYLNSGDVVPEERVLWNALLSAKPIDTAGLALTATTLTRATTLTNVATLAITAADFTAAGIAVNDVVTLKDVTSAVSGMAKEWNAPAVITALSPSATAATSVTLAYLTAPAAAATTAGTVTSISVHKGAWTTHEATTGQAAYALAHTGDSNRNQLQKFGMYFLIDDTLYAIDDCALDQASIDFGLDGIATVAWTGRGRTLRQLPSTSLVSSANPAVFSGVGNATGTAAAKNTAAHYITNKLSSMTLIAGINGQVGTSYVVPITGGSITYANNINYIVPANLGTVNTSIGYFTGARSITGNVTAYLKTGSGNTTATLLSDILSGTATTSETKFRLQIEIGGSTNAVRVELDIKGCMLQVPTIESADVMGVSINFTAQGHDPVLANNTFDLEQTNDMFVRYFAS